jgi:putative nucleotidyltransferase with HDIG domain
MSAVHVAAGRRVSDARPSRERRDVELRIAAALEAAIRLRAPGLHSSTPLVCRLSQAVGRARRMDEADLRLMALAARVRDIGMVGLPDAVVLRTHPFTPDDWEQMGRHPGLGARLLEGLDSLAPAAPIVRAHHERWDGKGYPDRLQGTDIPLSSRIIAICDAFVAIATDRPYRRALGAHAALELVRIERGVQFDPDLTDTFVALVERMEDGPPDVERALTDTGPPPPTGGRPARERSLARQERPRCALPAALAEFDAVPAFALARDRLLEALAAGGGNVGLVAAAVESDTGLTVAILRAAQPANGRRHIWNVVDALKELSSEQLQAAVRDVPTVRFPWRTTPLELLLHRSRIHAQAVARAVDRVACEAAFDSRDDLRTAALLHDVGRLVLARVSEEPADQERARVSTPEERAHDERRRLGFDHASLGALMVTRWGLPIRLARAVRNHHTETATDSLATFVRLGDMLVHHALGDAVDRRGMLRAAHACDLTAGTLRDVMFDLPHTGGSQWRRAERSPLTARETQVLAGLGAGKKYKSIAADLGLSTSTVRTHLQKVYAKVGVRDRAEAVLHATERGWL